jgi:hypothetical protein
MTPCHLNGPLNDGHASKVVGRGLFGKCRSAKRLEFFLVIGIKDQ